MVETTSPLNTAFRALESVRTEIKKRVGKEGGNLNQKVLAQLDVLETTLRQIEPLGNMLKVLNQQTEVAVHGFRALSRIQAALPEAMNGDDGSSETKGQ